MSDSDLIDLVEAMAQTRVLCVGDAMIDHYIWGRAERVSPEAPVPVLQIDSEEQRLGGAGNVLRNLHALGCSTCFISVIGDDVAGHSVARMIAQLSDVEAHVLHEADRTTTTKTRLIADTQQLLRVDRESVKPLPKSVRDKILDHVQTAAARYGHVVVSDYAKGLLGDGLAHDIIAMARGVGATVVVDPKMSDYSAYRGASVLKPNLRELSAAIGRRVSSEEEIVAAARGLMAMNDFGAILVTLGKSGMIVVEPHMHHFLPATARDVYDVTGAGDTVSAVLGAALAAGASLRQAAELANEAAGIVVSKVGTAVVARHELAQALIDRELVGRKKWVPLSLALDHVARWRRKGLTIGFTNGCFDILHPGHVSLLHEARANCDRLIVGLNGDDSVRRLKGSGRPLQSGEARAAVMSSLSTVDLIVVFEEDTPIKVLEAIRPDLLVKGADYQHKGIVGGDFVQSYGGKVLLAPLVPGQSTTAIVGRRNDS